MLCAGPQSSCTFFLTGCLRLSVGKVSQLHFSVYPREMAIPTQVRLESVKMDTRKRSMHLTGHTIKPVINMISRLEQITNIC